METMDSAKNKTFPGLEGPPTASSAPLGEDGSLGTGWAGERSEEKRSSGSQSESSWTSSGDIESKLSSCELGTDREDRKGSLSSSTSLASCSSATAVNTFTTPLKSRTSAATGATTATASPRSAPNSDSKSGRKFWGEEVNEDSIYWVYLKKITYSNSVDVSLRSPPDCPLGEGKSFKKDVFKRRSLGKSTPKKKSEDQLDSRVTRSDQIGVKSSSRVKEIEPTQLQTSSSLLWETRQIRILRAATFEHIISYVLLLTPHQQDQHKRINHCSSVLLEEERNNVAHVTHILFSSYRSYATPFELFSVLSKYSRQCCAKQFKFVLLYWLNNYPEDFIVPISENMERPRNSPQEPLSFASSGGSKRSESRSHHNQRLVDILLSLPKVDESVYRKALSIIQEHRAETSDLSTNNQTYSKGSSSCILELDSRFVAQQLTAIDLENFLLLKPYTLLDGPRSNPKVQNLIRNFNLLSRHVIVTILKSQAPDVVTNHWIEIAAQLRKMKNFNSLKAVIAGLTNESIYRLKNIVWSRLSRTATSSFKWLSTIVDDVNNQTLLRQTQLEIEGTAKVSLQEESFGTIPYLGTFLTDITVIDTKLTNYIQSSENSNEKRLVNLEKWSKQFEILTQVQLLQKNVRAALMVMAQSQHLNGLSQLPTFSSTPVAPRVARLFRNWFQDNHIISLNDNDCYKLSLALEPPPNKKC